MDNDDIYNEIDELYLEGLYEFCQIQNNEYIRAINEIKTEIFCRSMQLKWVRAKFIDCLIKTLN